MEDEAKLRLLLRAEFSEFRLALFQELQAKLDTKADRLPFELLAKDVAEIKVRSEAQKNLVREVQAHDEQLRGIERALLVEHEQRRGARGVLAWLRRAAGWVVAFAVAVADLFFRHHP